MRTENFVLLRLNDERLDRRDFGGLPPDDSLRFELRQVGLAGLAFGDGSRDDLIGIVHQGARLPSVASAVLPSLLSLWIRIGFLI
jgi:hypothetical protein